MHLLGVGINTDYHSGTKHSPFELRFGQKAVCGISDLPLSRDLLTRLHTEEALWDALPSAYRTLLDQAQAAMNEGETEDVDPRLQEEEEDEDEDDGDEDEDEEDEDDGAGGSKSTRNRPLLAVYRPFSD
jgi:hypothetical protein